MFASTDKLSVPFTSTEMFDSLNELVLSPQITAFFVVPIRNFELVFMSPLDCHIFFIEGGGGRGGTKRK